MRVPSIAIIAAIALACQGQSGEVATRAGEAQAYALVGPTPGGDSSRNSVENVYHRDRAAIGEGRRLFNWMNCSGCHGDHGGGGMGPSLRDSLWIYGREDAQIFSSISNGRARGMPAWGAKLPRDQIWKLVAYIRSLGTAQEADPPSSHREPSHPGRP